ncbi:MAG: glycine cleavage system protein GcvH [Candidatus Hermodarchaeota archaeon]
MSETKTPENLKYSKEHEWVLIEGGKAKIGITDYAQASLNDIVGFDLADDVEVGSMLKADEIFGEVNSVKAVSDLFTPIGGKIVECNEEAIDEPEKINEDPYGTWLIIIEPDNLDADMAKLMDAAGYKEFIATLE